MHRFGRMVSAKCSRFTFRLAIGDAYNDTNQQPDTHARHFHCRANQYVFSFHRYSYFHFRTTYANADAVN